MHVHDLILGAEHSLKTVLSLYRYDYITKIVEMKVVTEMAEIIVVERS